MSTISGKGMAIGEKQSRLMWGRSKDQINYHRDFPKISSNLDKQNPPLRNNLHPTPY